MGRTRTDFQWTCPECGRTIRQGGRKRHLKAKHPGSEALHAFEFEQLRRAFRRRGL